MPLNRVSTGIPGSGFQPGKTQKNHDFSGLENNVEKPGNNPEISGTRTSEFPGSGFQLGKISGSNPEPGKISWFKPVSNLEPGTQEFFRVPTRHAYYFL